MPQENSIYGPVTETYDMLRSADVGQTKFIKGEVTIAVQHCLIVRRGVRREDITRILSHDQVRPRVICVHAQGLTIGAAGSWAMRAVHRGQLPERSPAKDGVHSRSSTGIAQ